MEKNLAERKEEQTRLRTYLHAVQPRQRPPTFLSLSQKAIFDFGPCNSIKRNMGSIHTYPTVHLTILMPQNLPIAVFEHHEIRRWTLEL